MTNQNPIQQKQHQSQQQSQQQQRQQYPYWSHVVDGSSGGGVGVVVDEYSTCMAARCAASEPTDRNPEVNTYIQHVYSELYVCLCMLYTVYLCIYIYVLYEHERILLLMDIFYVFLYLCVYVC